MDEFHYYGDRERGIAWQIPLVTLRDTVFLLMSATLGDTTSIEQKLAAFTGREVASVRGAVRPVPLDFEYRDTPLHETIAELIKLNRAPIYLVNFTQRAAAEEVQNLMSVDVCSKDEKKPSRSPCATSAWTAPMARSCCAFSPRHRPAPRRPAAALPPHRRAPEPTRPAQGGERHRHAGRRGQHPDPHRAVHATVQVRRAEGRRSQRARVQGRSRDGRAARALTERGCGGGAGAGAYRGEPPV